MSNDPNAKELNTLSSRAELAAAALGSVYAANEFGKAIADNDEGAGDHYVKAAVGAAVAVGAFHQLQKKVSRESIETDGGHHPHVDHHGGHHERHSHHDEPARLGEPPHHTRHLLEEAAGLYSVGKELLGDKRHHVAHLIAEAMGAVGAIKDIQARGKERSEPEN